MKKRASSVKVELSHTNLTRGGQILHEQEFNTGLVYRQSLMKYTEKYGVSPPPCGRNDSMRKNHPGA